MNATFYSRDQIRNIRLVIILAVVLVLISCAVTFAQQHPLLRISASLDIQGSTADETVVHFMNGATLGFDPYDSEKFMNDGNQVANIYSKSFGNNPEILAVNGLPLAAMDQQELIIPLFLKVNSDGLWRIDFMERIDFPSDYKIVFVDSLLNTSIDIDIPSSYSFNFHTTDPDVRFYLILKPGNILSAKKQFVDNFIIYSYENKIRINNNGGLQDLKVTICDTNGRLLSNEIIDNTTLDIYMDKKPGIYLVNINSVDLSHTQKVLIW